MCSININMNSNSGVLLSSLGASISLISSTGHVVLGSPIGSSDYITSFAERAIDEARRILGLISCQGVTIHGGRPCIVYYTY